MIRRILERLGLSGRKRRPTPFDEIVVRMVENEIETFERQIAAREAGTPYVLLAPAVPLPASSPAGWFGGAPDLPEDVPWPDHDGEPLRFACQIDLAALPADLWGGLGPRHGWLAVFFHPDDVICRVLHVDGAVQTREGPPQKDASWFQPRPSQAGGPVPDYSPRWPIVATCRTGDLPPHLMRRKGYVPDCPDPREAEIPDLTDPAYQPFDAATLTALLEAVGKDIDKDRRTILALLAKTLRDGDRTTLFRMQDASRDAATQFAAIRAELSPFEQRFDLTEVRRRVPLIAALPAFRVTYQDNDKEGYAALDLATRTIAAALKEGRRPLWYFDYRAQLHRDAIHAYTRRPEALPEALRAHMEAIWRFDALHEQAGMGHAPCRHLYTPYGQDTPNELLLELPSSELVGWAWGDLYSIALFIDRGDLARGNFDDVTCEISN
ncbi:DUF1963 domain-containing protein [Zavarzinia sp.]|uniref:DUF1963 domain-containing protein n=1 Tax=Zavarzinia sp. TaxID=2027920 RepID=UPI003566257E